MLSMRFCLIIALFFTFIHFNLGQIKDKLKSFEAWGLEAKRLEQEEKHQAALGLRLKQIETFSSLVLHDSLRAQVLNRAASLYDDLGEYDKSLELYWQSLELFEKVFGKNSSNYINNLNSIGVTYDNKSQFQQARVFYEQTLALIQENSGENNLDYCHTLNNLSITYANLGQYRLAETLQRQVLAIKQNFLEADDLEFTGTYMNIGNNLVRQNRFNEAHLQYNQAAKIFLSNKMENKPVYIRLLHNQGVCYMKQKNFKKAEEFLSQALIKRENLYGRQHPQYLITCLALGELAQKQGHYEQAKIYLEQAWAFEIGKPANYYNLYILQILTEFYLHLGDTIKARKHLELFFQRQCEGFRSLERLDLGLMVNCLNFEHWAKGLSILFHLNPSIETIELALASLEIKRRNLSGQDQKNLLITTHSWIGLALNYIWDSSKDMELAWNLVERGRSFLVEEQGQSQDKLSLALKKDWLKQQALFLSSALEPRKQNEYLDSMNQTQLALQKHLEGLVGKKEAYVYESLERWQRQLPKATGVLVLHQDSTKLYALYLDAERQNFQALDLKAEFIQEKVKRLRATLTQFDVIINNFEENRRDYTDLAYWFYKNIIEKSLAKDIDIKHLLIITDDALGQIPFEVLLTEPAKAKDTYHDLRYLNLQYNISYAYSVRLWLKQNQSKLPKRASLLGIAASYEAVDSGGGEKVLRGLYQKNLRKNLVDLPQARRELVALSQRFKGDFLIGREANEANLVEALPRHEILHFAVHGLLDWENPDLSSLALTEDNNRLQDNFLQAYELSFHDWTNTYLVVLSACETGYGRFEKGLGAASLARSFSEVGVASQVVSLWQVNDASTSILMQLFYENLARGLNKAEALREAQMAYRRQVGDMAAHPAFWGAFVCFGDIRPLAIETLGYSYGEWLGIGLGIGLMILFVGLSWHFWARRKAKNA